MEHQNSDGDESRKERKKKVNFQSVSLKQVMLQLSAGFTSKQSHVLEVQLHSVLLLSQHSHYPPWCLPRSWYRLHSWGCWAQPSPADSAETWEHHHTEESQRGEEVREEGKNTDGSIFVSQSSPLPHVSLTSSWTRCSRFLYVFWTSSLVPSTPYHIMFLVRLLQEEAAGRKSYWSEHIHAIGTSLICLILFGMHESVWHSGRLYDACETNWLMPQKRTQAAFHRICDCKNCSK